MTAAGALLKGFALQRVEDQELPTALVVYAVLEEVYKCYGSKDHIQLQV